jgi:hypothetical protein
MSDGRWSLRNIYLYAVCLITLIMVIVGTANGVRNVVELAYPDPGYAYWSVPVKVPGESGMTEEELAEQERLQRAQQTRQGALNLAGNAALVLIAGPLYVYHWRKIEVEHVEKPQPTPAASV